VKITPETNTPETGKADPQQTVDAQASTSAQRGGKTARFRGVRIEEDPSCVWERSDWKETSMSMRPSSPANEHGGGQLLSPQNLAGDRIPS